ncbi:MAG: integrase core domain-containing protein [Armatimonadota bacterium]
MSAMRSPAIDMFYGVERVCSAWEQPRSTYYSQVARANTPTVSSDPKQKRGPKTELSDDELLGVIGDAIKGSSFKGEGYRKIWAYLKYGASKLRVGHNRVLRVMRENDLLSPYRVRQADDSAHDRTITTDAPNEMWGTDGTQVMTVEDGHVWVFSAVEHWNAECVGMYVCKSGTRFNAVQPVLEGVQSTFGSVDRGIAQGLSLRLDHGSANCSEHFQREINRLGIAPSFSFVEEPQTNGVVERFNRTLKEQVVYGRTFRNIDEVRTAMLDFRHAYNRLWRLGKLGFMTPLEARQHYENQCPRLAAA